MRLGSGQAPAAASPNKSGGWGKALLGRIQDYYWQSNLPFTILVFLLPLAVLYEIGTRLFNCDVIQQTETRVLAFNLMRQFLAWFGATGQYLPLLAMVGILLTWHIARHDPWKPQLGTASVMALESVVLAFPLLAISQVVGHWLPLAAASGAWRSGIVLAVGAGIYEELVFRLITFTVLNILLIDLLRVSKRPAYLLMVVSSAVLFASYHYWSPQSQPLRWPDFVFRTLSGMYFGVLFISRGFGITCGSHIAYDVYDFIAPALLGR